MKDNNHINITKASGENVLFSRNKLMQSLQRAGAAEDTAADIANEVAAGLYPNISTKKIYRLAFSLLRRHSSHTAARYHLKPAMMELGPTGYLFERFVGELLKHMGHNVRVGQIVQGQCVNHEVDVLAEKGNQVFMIECKYHNTPGSVCDVKIPLYIQARFKDIEAGWKELPEHEQKLHQAWVVTNTRFSSDAIKYGMCAGLRLIGWDYPTKGSLKDMVEAIGLYPITCLTSLTRQEKKNLLGHNILLCTDLQQNPNWLDKIGITEARQIKIIEENRALCKNSAFIFRDENITQ